jgi:hypothetical protein
MTTTMATKDGDEILLVNNQARTTMRMPPPLFRNYNTVNVLSSSNNVILPSTEIQHQQAVEGQPIVMPFLLSQAVLDNMPDHHDPMRRSSSSCFSSSNSGVSDDLVLWGGPNNKTTMMISTLEILEMALDLLNEEEEDDLHRKKTRHEGLWNQEDGVL